MDIILASKSKRRSAILSSCRIRHRVIVSSARESMKGKLPSAIAIKNACLKAQSIKKSGYIIGADTVVLLGKKIIGKPHNAAHAKSMLKAMSGKTISVYTGLCVIDSKRKKMISGYERSKVTVKKIRPAEISRFFKLLGPYDKAGGFSIEGVGSFIFDDIKGSYFNVLGLPMAKLKELFEKIGADILKAIC
ncbi:MAG: nucleoside triphosphate pyrophosphatase [Candidatus Gorgyraea atricola]|nr:nucleoside triphosphate pyrophosphatase [Candidatus Gorgyraea atricola]